MWSIAICDDCRREGRQVKELLEAYCEEKNIAMETELFQDGSFLYQKMEAGSRYDVIFVDILMNEMDGIQLGYKLRHCLEDEVTQLIYMSHVRQYADLDRLCGSYPIGFVGKPIRKEEIYRMAGYVRKQSIRSGQWFFYRKDRMIYQVSYEEIRYFQSVGRKIAIHTSCGVKEFYGKLSDVLEKGLPLHFIRIHQSYVINRDYIASVGRKRVYLRGERGYFSISQPYRQSAMRRFQGFGMWKFDG